MQKRKLGTIEVSPIGVGCMGFSHGYGEIPSGNTASRQSAVHMTLAAHSLTPPKRMAPICFQRTEATMKRS